MSVVFGIIAAMMGAVGFVAAIIRAVLGDVERSHRNEVGTVLWFILAAVLLK